MTYQPIENYGMIGDMHTVALVGTDGSIDWLCVPRFDSPSVFAAILDDGKGGRFKIAPVGDDVTSTRHRGSRHPQVPHGMLAGVQLRPGCAHCHNHDRRGYAGLDFAQPWSRHRAAP